MLSSLRTLLRELRSGPAPDASWVLNPGDAGLLRSLDNLTAADASRIVGNTSVAAHVDHLRYGLGLLNRWSAGESPFGDADYSASWRRVSVSDESWRALRAALREEIDRWSAALEQRRGDLSETDLTTIASSVVHLAYHLGAIRQMHRALQGPPASPNPDQPPD